MGFEWSGAMENKVKFTLNTLNCCVNNLAVGQQQFYGTARAVLLPRPAPSPTSSLGADAFAHVGTRKPNKKLDQLSVAVNTDSRLSCKCHKGKIATRSHAVGQLPAANMKSKCAQPITIMMLTASRRQGAAPRNRLECLN